MGNAGQSDYAAANGFLDSFAHWRTQQVKLNQRTGKTLSINWPLWQDGGMQVSPETEAYFHSQGMGVVVNRAQGIAVLERAIHLSFAQLGVYPKLENKTCVLEEQEQRINTSTESNNELLSENIIQELKVMVADVLKLLFQFWIFMKS